MEVLKLIIFEYLLGYVLQGFTITLGVYAFNRRRIELKPYVLASALVIVISYFVRLLPIGFGVHAILNVLFLFLICTFFLQMPAHTTVRSALLATVLLVVCEMIDVWIVVAIIGIEKFESLMLVPSQKALISTPGSILFIILTGTVYMVLNNPRKRKGESIGEVSA